MWDHQIKHILSIPFTDDHNQMTSWWPVLPFDWNENPFSFSFFFSGVGGDVGEAWQRRGEDRHRRKRGRVRRCSPRSFCCRRPNSPPWAPSSPQSSTGCPESPTWWQGGGRKDAFSWSVESRRNHKLSCWIHNLNITQKWSRRFTYFPIFKHCI